MRTGVEVGQVRISVCGRWSCEVNEVLATGKDFVCRTSRTSGAKPALEMLRLGDVLTRYPTVVHSPLPVDV